MSGVARSAWRGVRSVVGAPPVVGAALVVALAAWAGQRGSGDDADLGGLRRADAIESFIEHRFAVEITRMKVGIVATALCLGLIVGLVADVLMRLRARGGRGARGGTRGLIETALVCAGLHASIVAWSMADSPQLYASRWYAQGGVSRTVQVIVTDVLGTRGVVAVGVIAAIAYVGPRVRHLRVFRLRPVVSLRRILAVASSSLIVAIAPGAAQGPTTGTRAPQPPSAAAATPAPTPNTRGEEGRARRPNILLLAADSLRADRITPELTPTLHALTRSPHATTFARAYVSLPRTFPSWVTLLTGRHPHRHGVR